MAGLGFRFKPLQLQNLSIILQSNLHTLRTGTITSSILTEEAEGEILTQANNRQGGETGRVGSESGRWVAAQNEQILAHKAFCGYGKCSNTATLCVYIYIYTGKYD